MRKYLVVSLVCLAISARLFCGAAARACDIEEEAEIVDEESFSYSAAVPLTESQQRYVYETAEEYDIVDHVDLVYGLMYVESRFTEDAVSYNWSSFGIMQVNEINREWLVDTLGREPDLLDFEDNVECGVALLAWHLQDYDIEPALMCYAKGRAGATTYFEQGVFSTAHSKAVLEYIDNI